MLNFNDNIIFGDSIKENLDLIKIITSGRRVFDIYFICKAQNSNNLSEIISCYEIYKPLYNNRNYNIIGICGNKSEAINLSIDMILQKYDFI